MNRKIMIVFLILTVFSITACETLIRDEMTIAKTSFPANDVRSQGEQVQIGIHPPEWIQGKWMDLEFDEFGMIFKPDYIDFMGNYQESIFETLNDSDPFLPEPIRKKFLFGRYYALKVTSNIVYAQIYTDGDDPLPNIPQGPQPAREPGRKYLRSLVLHQFEINGVMQWVYSIDYYYKVY